jgi:replication factor C subunit 2/4
MVRKQPVARPKAGAAKKGKTTTSVASKAKSKNKGKTNAKNKNKSKSGSKSNAMRAIPKMADFKTLFDDTNILKFRTDSSRPRAGIRRHNPSIWVDKYRPRTLDEVIGHDDIKNVIKNATETGDLPHLLLYGMPGTGKTSITHAMIRELYGNNDLNVLELNASDENGINVVRDKIIRFASLETARGEDENSPKFKVIILDEADSMTSEAQTALKKAMEKTCKITRFVIICNYVNKIIDAIRSRCASFRFNPIPNDKMIEKLKHIADTEKMIIADEKIYTTITEICEGDARRSINTLQNLKYIPVAQPDKEAIDNIRMERMIRDLPHRIRKDIMGPKIPQKNADKEITVDDVYLITSSIDYNYFNRYWKRIIKCPDTSELNNITHSIVIEGYPMDFVLKFFKDMVLESDLADPDKADILIYIGNVERMLINGSGNHIQTMGILTLIVSKFKGIQIRVPEIY